MAEVAGRKWRRMRDHTPRTNSRPPTPKERTPTTQHTREKDTPATDGRLSLHGLQRRKTPALKEQKHSLP